MTSNSLFQCGKFRLTGWRAELAFVAILSGIFLAGVLFGYALAAFS